MKIITPVAVAMLCTTSGGAPAETAVQLGLPIACTLGADCFVQQYADIDPSAKAHDFRCGTATYDGHQGTDFRVLSLEAAERGVAVVASAAGRISAARDGVADRLIASRTDAAAIIGVECGNGVVIQHENGWETQYCHLKRGSVTVRTGDTIAAGAQLGLVGYSGNAQFAHVHLTVRHNGKIVDPFSGEGPSGACNAGDATLSASLWAPELHPALAYADAVIIQAGFADRPVSPEDAEKAALVPPVATSPAMVFYARLINLHKDDSLRLTATGPGSFMAASRIAPLPRPKAQYVAVAGKKLTTERWPSGRYEGQVEVIRDGKIIGRRQIALELP